MKKQLKEELCSKWGLVEKPKNVLSGKVRDFYVTIHFYNSDRNYRIGFNAMEGERPPLARIEDYMDSYKKNHKYVQNIVYSGNLVEFGGMVTRKVQQQIEEIVEESARFFSDNGYVSGCCICDDPTKECKINGLNGQYVLICDDCLNELEQQFEEKKSAIKNKPCNLVAGMVGALFGALIGAIVWFVIYQLGYVATISAVIMVVASLKGFELLGHRLTIVGAVISIAICAVVCYVTHRFCLAYTIYDAMGKYQIGNYRVGLFDVFKNLDEWMKGLDGSHMADAYKDLIYGYLGLVIAGIPTAISMYKEKAGHYSIERIEE